MAGHSKWNNIKRKKEKTDGAKAKIFTKIGRELAVAVKEGGGPDPSSNSKLKDCIAKAKACNVPNDNIERIIKKAAGETDGEKFESIVYEGYGPCGVAVIVLQVTYVITLTNLAVIWVLLAAFLLCLSKKECWL